MFIPEKDFIPNNLKIKLLDKFKENKSKLDLFLAQYKLYIVFNKYN